MGKDKVQKVKKEKVTKEKVTKKEKATKGPNRDKVKPGDTYAVQNTVEVADVDGDQVSDLVVTHSVTRNGLNFTEARVVWYGLEQVVLDQFLAIIDELALVTAEPVVVNKFNQVVRQWRKLEQLIHAFAEVGDQAAVEMGEDLDEADDVEVVVDDVEVVAEE